MHTKLCAPTFCRRMGQPYRLAARLGSTVPVITAVECLQMTYTLLQLATEMIKRGLIHNDICPPNVLVDVAAPGGANTVLAALAAMTRMTFKVADMDILGETSAPQTMVVTAAGSAQPALQGHPWSRPLEAADQPADGSKLSAADLFGVGGCLLYVMARCASPDGKSLGRPGGAFMFYVCRVPCILRYRYNSSSLLIINPHSRSDLDYRRCTY